ncbi:MAG: GtrA family protein [Muribaculaceae bacterium]|jgi:putative flippase GtrA|nr:GtrA family protein [Muribaculaceae bacterium]
MNSTQIRQFFKYCMVGVMNTSITLAVIFVCKSILGINPYVSNVIGYVCGLINSFLWNKQWVFRSRNGYYGEVVRFAAGFGVCFLLQFAVVWSITHTPFGVAEFEICGFVLSGYGIATLFGSVVYTISNFLFNRFVTFRKD